MTTLSILLQHGARDLDAYRPATLRGPHGWRLARTLLERHRAALGLDDVTPAGDGRTGWVFRARQPSLGRIVAVKVGRQQGMRPADDPLHAQSSAMAALDHPGVPRVYASGRLGAEGPSHALLEWIDGETLERRLAERRFCDVADGVAIVLQVAAVLQHGHGRGFVHGDIRPANILVPAATSRSCVLVDWAGRVGGPDASTTDDGPVCSSADYLSPERMRRGGARPDAADDLWALGVILYRALTGQLPAVLRAGPVQPLAARAPHLPCAVARVVDKALASDPASRHRTAAAMVADLVQCLGEPRVTIARPESSPSSRAEEAD